MTKMIPKEEVNKIICKYCIEFNGYCEHHWDCPVLTEIAKFGEHKDEPQTEYDKYREKIEAHDPHKDWFEDKPQMKRRINNG